MADRRRIKGATQKSLIEQKYLVSGFKIQVSGLAESTDSTETVMVDFPLRAVELNLQGSGLRVNGSRFMVLGRAKRQSRLLGEWLKKDKCCEGMQ